MARAAVARRPGPSASALAGFGFAKKGDNNASAHRFEQNIPLCFQRRAGFTADPGGRCRLGQAGSRDAVGPQATGGHGHDGGMREGMAWSRAVASESGRVGESRH